MGIIDRITGSLRWLGVYLSGRGLITLGVILAGAVAAVTGAGFILPALVIAAGGTTLKWFMRAREQRIYEQGMIGLYRDDIAATLGISPDSVTREHLYAVAKDNDIIGQALIRQRRESMVELVTAVVAGAATFGLLYFGLAHTQLASFLTTQFGQVLGGVLGFFSMGIVAGTTSLIVHDGLSAAVETRAGLTKAVAHDRILRMEWQVHRHRPVSAEQVFGVVVASSPVFERRIHQQFGKNYTAMDFKERWQVMESAGVAPNMAALAEAINTRQIRPSSLAFVLDQKSAASAAEVLATQEARAPARASFVERVGGRRSPQGSHRDRLDAQRQETSSSRAI